MARATYKDAEHVLNRMRGCGYVPEAREYENLLKAVASSTKYGHGDLSDSERAFDHFTAAGGKPGLLHYNLVLESASWSAYWKLRKASNSETAGGVVEHSAEWGNRTWTVLSRYLDKMQEEKIECDCSSVTLCASVAKHCGLQGAVVRTWQMFRNIQPKLRSSALYTEMIAALGSVGNSEAAFGLLGVASKHKFRPTSEMTAAALATCKTAGEAEEMLRKIEAMGAVIPADAASIVARLASLALEADGSLGANQ
mmetsp:Transcript_43483/g.68084  ORF Transcript_43483/g.68084 Transcript_43483/m.68084 type:complete len:254 (+) Transcript_43483:2-763(+)